MLMVTCHRESRLPLRVLAATLVLSLGWASQQATGQAPGPAGPAAGPGKDDGKQGEGRKADKADKAAAQKPKGSAAQPLEWLTLELGLAKMRPKRLPGLVLFEPPSAPPAAGSPPPAGFLDEHLADSTTRQLLKRFVLIRVTADDLKKAYPGLPLPTGPLGAKPGADPGKRPPAEGKSEGKKGGPKGVEEPGNDPVPPPVGPADPPGGAPAAPAGPVSVEASVAARLGIGGTQAALLVLSYWEEAVLSHVGSLPKKDKLRSELSRVVKVNEVYAAEARRVEPLVEKSRYAAKLNNWRDAVLAVRDLEGEKPQVHLDPYLKKRLHETIAEYRAKAREEIRKADDLDKQKKYFDALDAFDKIASNFPFQDIQKQAAVRKGEILRKQAIGGR